MVNRRVVISTSTAGRMVGAGKRFTGTYGGDVRSSEWVRHNVVGLTTVHPQQITAGYNNVTWRLPVTVR